MSLEDCCYCLERVGTRTSPVALLEIEEVLKREGLEVPVSHAIVNTFRDLLNRALEAEDEVRSLKSEVDAMQARIEESV